jgi:gliding motility-associated-like protein
MTGTWSPDFNDKVTTVYTFIPDNNQCVDALPVKIEVIVKPLSECIEYELFPKFFTPNGNGQNDTWQLNVLAESNQTGSYAEVYDRYGKEIITLTPSNNSWDGTYKGTPMPSNDYWFVLYYIDKSGKKVSKTGHFSLKR